MVGTGVNPIYVLGVPPQGPSGIQERWQSVLGRAEWIYGGKRVLGMLPAGRRTVEIHSPLAELAAHLGDHPEALRVVLATGDPNFFGIAEYLYRHFPVNALVVAPALSSMQEAFSRLKMSWHDAFFGSVHGRPLEQAVLWVARHEKVAILTDPRHNAAALAQTLTRAGFAECELHVCQNLGMGGENIAKGLAKDLQQCPDGGFSVVVVRNPRARWAAYGLEDSQLERRDDQPGMVTKKSVRAVSIAQLHLGSHSVLWDIGAGTGAVSIDASRVIGTGGAVYAIEAHPRDYAILCRNLRQHQAPVYPVMERAPAGLDSLPEPDAAFIGGSGGQLASIVRYLDTRMASGTRIVMTVVQFEHLAALPGIFPSGYRWTVQMVNTAVMDPLNPVPRFQPDNPVFVVTAMKGVM